MLAINRKYSLAAIVALLSLMPAATAQDNGQQTKPFQLGVQDNQYSSGPAYPDYPAPQMIQPQPAPVAKPHKLSVQHNAPMQTGIQQTQQRPPMQAAAQALPPGVLPNQFLGNWLVLGQRAKVEARPEFQAGIDNIFTMSNSQTWNIVGQPGRYQMSSDTGVSQVQVGNCTTSTAFIRYGHPIKNTVAREAIVLQISPDGRQFQGMQRISIMKQGEPGPRATVTYNLMGQRQ
ncbi:MAG TPA: hypothetical protein V6D22_04010 [Candidatus Obscuribacterales bacterium]